MSVNKRIPYLHLIPIIFISFILFKLVNDKESLKWVLKVLSPFIWAFAIGYILNPMVKSIERNFKLKRGWSILITYVIVFGIVVFVITIVTPNVIDSVGTLVSNMPNYIKQLEKYVELNLTKIELLQDYGIISYSQSILDKTLNKSSTVVDSVLNTAIIQAINVTSIVIKLLISITISIYLLKDKETLLLKIKRTVYAIFGYDKAKKIIKVAKETDDIFSKYLVGKLIDSIIIGILCFIIVSIAKIPYSLLISVIIGVTNMIPYFGPIIGAVPSVFIVLLINPIKALWILIIIFILQQFDGLYLGPKILGDQVGIRPFWVISAITLGGAMFGVVGMFLGVPVIAVIKMLVERYVGKKLDDKNINI